MSQVNSYDREQYATNGVTKTFSFGWDVNDKSDVKVKFVDDNGVIVEYATFIDPNDQEYTTSNFSFVVELNRQGGTITFVDIPAENQNIIIYRQTELVYENSFKTATAFPAVAIDNAYRKIWLAIQEVQSDAKHNTVRMTSDQRGLTFDEFADTVNNHLVYYASGALHYTDFTTYDIETAIYWAGQVQQALADANEALNKAGNAIIIANNAKGVAEQARDDASAAVQTANNAYALASSALQAGDNISLLYNDAGYITRADIQTYTHDQAVASSVWTINHGLGKHPSITVVDSGGNVVSGTYTYVDENTMIAEFNSAFKGTAYLN